MGKTYGSMCKDSSYCLNNEISKTDPDEEKINSSDNYFKKKTKKKNKHSSNIKTNFRNSSADKNRRKFRRKNKSIKYK